MENEFVEKLDHTSQIVTDGFAVMKEFYGPDIRRTTISSIIDGEHISVEPDNIRIDEPVDPAIIPETLCQQIDKLFTKFCTKPSLYQFQRQAIIKILEMEAKQSHIDPVTGKTIVSNAYQLSLPIGAGKSLIFEFLALFYSRVPEHPIIVSTDGKAIPPHEQIQFDQYPYYYENVAYVKEDANAVMALTCSLPQRPTTIILTHRHLLEQMHRYFNDDFTHDIIASKKIGYFDSHQITPDTNIDLDIIVAVAEENNVNQLIKFSYIRPFARVVIDDYTSMNTLQYLRQIITYSLIPVSGHGFEQFGTVDNRQLSANQKLRKMETREVPSSYYSMKNVPADKITLVGDPNAVYEGVLRDNILTAELMTAASNLNVYEFLSSIESLIARMPGCTSRDRPGTIFSEIGQNPVIEKYIKWGFFVQNLNTFRSMVPMLVDDINNKIVPKDKVSHFWDWYSTTKDQKFRDIMMTPVDGGRNVKSMSTLVDSDCVICKAKKDVTCGFGIIAGCCGSFICHKCIEQAATYDITDGQGHRYTDTCQYCRYCRAKNPHYYFNSTQHSSQIETRSFTLAQRYFDCHEVEGHYPIDYYFYMAKSGFTFRPDRCRGQPIVVYNDIKQGLIKQEDFDNHHIEKIGEIISGDILFPQLITAIEKTLIHLNVTPEPNSEIIVYRCPSAVYTRLENQFENLKANPKSPLKSCRLHSINNLGTIIGQHFNCFAILVYTDESEAGDRHQLIGRMLRLQAFGQKLLFYIVNNNGAYL